MNDFRPPSLIVCARAVSWAALASLNFSSSRPGLPEIETTPKTCKQTTIWNPWNYEQDNIDWISSCPTSRSQLGEKGMSITGASQTSLIHIDSHGFHTDSITSNSNIESMLNESLATCWVSSEVILNPGGYVNTDSTLNAGNLHFEVRHTRSLCRKAR